ncbi:Glutamine--tRNA ligase [bioreactor metagenome]|uniref:Glutamine--tRNA ligase n=1 Tax=bioreactor metagenome TaxID=1076179 RepID=A0A644Z4C4_9ZZZZ
MYTFAHPIEDALEHITHSICTLEFEDQRPFYDWLMDRLCEGGLLAGLTGDQGLLGGLLGGLTGQSAALTDTATLLAEQPVTTALSSLSDVAGDTLASVGLTQSLTHNLVA